MLPAAAVPASRITVVPIKPGTKDAILEVANSADFKSGLEGEAFSGLIEVSVIVTACEVSTICPAGQRGRPEAVRGGASGKDVR